MLDLLSFHGAALTAIAFGAAVMTAVIGSGGGLLILALATIMPTPSVIPTHACLMLVGSFNNWFLYRDRVCYEIIPLFIVGGVIGLLLTWPFVGLLNPRMLTIILATFLLTTTWFKLPGAKGTGPRFALIAGGITSFASVFVGASRTLLMAAFAKRFNEHAVAIATTSACGALQHIGKIAVFTANGANFFSQWPTIFAMVVATLAGGWTGHRIVMTTDQARLKRLLKITITVLAVALILDGSGLVDWR